VELKGPVKEQRAVKLCLIARMSIGKPHTGTRCCVTRKKLINISIRLYASSGAKDAQLLGGLGMGSGIMTGKTKPGCM